MGRVIREKKNSKAYRVKRKLTDQKVRVIDQRFLRLVRQPPMGITYVAMGRRVTCYLMPLAKKGSPRGDVIVRLRPTYYYGFLEEIDEETLPNGERWYTLQFDCMSAEYVLGNLPAMLQPGFRFDQMAQDAESCVIEFSLRADRAQAIDQYVRSQPLGKIQGLQEGTWWRLSELNTMQPYAILATKYLPYPGSDDPTSIASACEEVAAVISDLRIPREDVLRALVALSHPGELASRYPGR